jgi:hypothetical protein
MAASRSNPTPTSKTLATLVEPELSLYKTDLTTAGLTGVAFEVPSVQTLKRTSPTWNTAPSNSGRTTNSITMSMSNNTAGETACVAMTGSVTDKDNKPTSE